MGCKFTFLMFLEGFLDEAIWLNFPRAKRQGAKK
jgi:hypothetical protein